MLTPSRARRRPAGTGDDGVGLVAVIGSFTLVMVVLLGTLAYIAASVRFARWEQDSTAAEAAAQSGIHDFLTWLRLDERYLADADPTRTGPQDYCGNPAVVGPDVVLPADLAGGPVCSNWDASTPVGWVAVAAGAIASPDTPSFHYRVVESDPVGRTLVLEVVGRSKDVYRTLQARLGIPAPTDFVYFSDYELANPEDETAYPDNPHYTGSQDTSAECGGDGAGSPLLRYAWDTTKGTGRTYIPATGGTQVADCRVPLFGGTHLDQTIEGPVHSNDTFRASVGQSFVGPFSTSDPACTGLDPTAGSASWAAVCLSPDANTAEFSQMPEYVAPLELPGSVAALKEIAEAGVGCRYEGATRIVPNGTSGRIFWVKSPGTKSVLNRGCGSPSALSSPSGAVVDLDAVGGLIVVTDSDDAALSREVYSLELTTGMGVEFPVGMGFTGQSATVGATYRSDLTMRDPIKQARYGNLYVEGVVGRPITFVAEQSIVLTGDLLVAGGTSGTTTVGLVAGGSVEVFHPQLVTWTGVAAGATGEAYWRHDDPVSLSGYMPKRYATSGPAQGLSVQAAILALGGSFQVQQWSVGNVDASSGPAGELRVEGSIAQRFRGVVGMDPPPSCLGCDDPQTGYWKNYTYDERLRRGLRPPYFPTFSSTWSVLWTEEHATDAAVRTT